MRFQAPPGTASCMRKVPPHLPLRQELPLGTKSDFIEGLKAAYNTNGYLTCHWCRNSLWGHPRSQKVTLLRPKKQHTMRMGASPATAAGTPSRAAGGSRTLWWPRGRRRLRGVAARAAPCPQSGCTPVYVCVCVCVRVCA